MYIPMSNEKTYRLIEGSDCGEAVASVWQENKSCITCPSVISYPAWQENHFVLFMSKCKINISFGENTIVLLSFVVVIHILDVHTGISVFLNGQTYLCSKELRIVLHLHHVSNIFCFTLVMTLFMMSVEVRSPLIMESITLPCLKILLKLVKPPQPSSKTNKVCFVHDCYTIN